jgi:hypothetical protein
MQSRAYSTFAVFAPTFGFSGFSLGPQRWVWVGSCNPKPSVGSRFRTQTQLWVGFGLGWVWVFWVLAMSTLEIPIKDISHHSVSNLVPTPEP